MKVALYTPLPRLAGDLCDVLRLFWPVDGYAVKATAPLTAEDAAKAQYTATPITPDMEPLTHIFTEHAGVWQCSLTFRGQSITRAMPVPSAAEDHAARLQPSVPGDAAAPQRPPQPAPAAPAPGEPADAITTRRLQKRLCKLALYDLCKQLTGTRPPWGSLTGIRPTRLVYEGLEQELSLEAAAARVAAAFDVAPPKAELLRRIVAVQQTLPAPSLAQADVYVSIPFCRTRCAYCSFPGEALGSPAHTAAYLQALFLEMRATAALLRDQGLALRALYIGGGTPTALNEPDFAALLAEAAACFPDPYEFTVEAGRPDTITPGKLAAMTRHRVTRVSVNPQTLNDETLRRIGRDHTAAQTAEAFALARSMGFANINMDVIAGLPGETPADFARTMEGIQALHPDSLTVHTLAIKRASRLHLEAHTPAPAEAVAQMVAMGEDAAARMGMEPYYLYRQKYMAGQQQNVGYARPGAACLYNVDIMEEVSAILACGAGAISKRVFQDRGLRIERAPNVSNVTVYGQRVAEMIARKAELFR